MHDGHRSETAMTRTHRNDHASSVTIRVAMALNIDTGNSRVPHSRPIAPAFSFGYRLVVPNTNPARITRNVFINAGIRFVSSSTVASLEALELAPNVVTLADDDILMDERSESHLAGWTTKY